MKATLVLLPLLGITYMLFFVNPGEDDLSQIVFIYFNSFLQSFQVSPAAAVHFPGLGAQTGSTQLDQLSEHQNTSACTFRPLLGSRCCPSPVTSIPRFSCPIRLERS